MQSSFKEHERPVRDQTWGDDKDLGRPGRKGRKDARYGRRGLCGGTEECKDEEGGRGSSRRTGRHRLGPVVSNY